MGGQVTFFLNSASNLSSNGWKLPAKGVNESCMSEHRDGGGGSRQAGRSWRREGPRGFCLHMAVSPESGGDWRSTLPWAGRPRVGGSLSTSLSAHWVSRIRAEVCLHSSLLIAKGDLWPGRLPGQSGAGAGPRHPSLMAAWLASGLSLPLVQIPQRAGTLCPQLSTLWPQICHRPAAFSTADLGMTPEALDIALWFFWALWVPGPQSPPYSALGGVPYLGDTPPPVHLNARMLPVGDYLMLCCVF